MAIRDRALIPVLALDPAAIAPVRVCRRTSNEGRRRPRLPSIVPSCPDGRSGWRKSMELWTIARPVLLLIAALYALSIPLVMIWSVLERRERSRDHQTRRRVL